MRRLIRLILTLATAGALMALPAEAAFAYGEGAGHEMWQVGISENCTDADLCAELGAGTGGFWAWVEFDRDGTETWGDLKGSFCYHLVGGGGPGQAGAVANSIEITSWTIEPGSAGPETFYASGEETDFGAGGTKVTYPFEHFDTGIPAVPGHYSSEQIFGFSAPGLAVQIQVAYRPAR